MVSTIEQKTAAVLPIAMPCYNGDGHKTIAKWSYLPYCATVGAVMAFGSVAMGTTTSITPSEIFYKGLSQMQSPSLVRKRDDELSNIEINLDNIDFKKSDFTIAHKDWVNYQKINLGNAMMLHGAESNFFSKKSVLGNSDFESILKKLGQVRSLILLSNSHFDRCFISLTRANSLFFRLFVDNSSLEFKFDVFYDYDRKDENDIEATLQIYQSRVNIESHYGSMEYLFSLIAKTVAKNQESYATISY